MLSKLWRDPVGSKVIAAGILAALAAIGTYLGGLWPAIGAWLSIAWKWLGASSALKNWVVVLLALCALTVTGGLGLLVWSAVFSSDAPSASWLGYTQDEFLGLKWRWRYDSSGQILNLLPFCARCDYQIRPMIRGGYNGNTTTYPCEDCGHLVGPFTDSPSGVEGRVERKIHKHLRNDTWPRTEA